MNTLEKNILELLSSDARLGAEAIASMLGEQPSAVKALIRSLEERGAIVKYTVISNGELLDETAVEALIEVKVTPKKGEGFDWMGQADRGARGSKRGVSHERRLRSRGVCRVRVPQKSRPFRLGTHFHVRGGIEHGDSFYPQKI